MRKGRVAALAGILAAAVGMGLFFPDLVVNVADQKMEDQEEHFSVDTTASFADGRLTDMMRLAMSYVDEIYLYSGVEQSEGDVASIAGNIAAKLSEDGILPPDDVRRRGDGSFCGGGGETGDGRYVALSLF